MVMGEGATLRASMSAVARLNFGCLETAGAETGSTLCRLASRHESRADGGCLSPFRMRQSGHFMYDSSQNKPKRRE
jgi:hypothetical protein